MADKITIRLVPTGALDYDSEDSKIASSDYRFGENMRNSVTYTGEQIVPCNMKGNVLVAYTLSSANSQCLGSLEDLDGTVFFFVWSFKFSFDSLKLFGWDSIVWYSL